MRRKLIALVVGVTVLTPALASAHHVTVRDADDVRGILDVKRVDGFGRRFNPGWTITTFQRWSNRRIWDRGYFVIYLDTFGDAAWDYYALVRSTGDSLEALLFRDRVVKRDYVIRRLTKWRPNSRSVSVRVPFSAIRFPETRTYYKWRVKTLDNDPCPRVCIDNVPDRRRVREEVRTAEPLPIE